MKTLWSHNYIRNSLPFLYGFYLSYKPGTHWEFDWIRSLRRRKFDARVLPVKIIRIQELETIYINVCIYIYIHIHCFFSFLLVKYHVLVLNPREASSVRLVIQQTSAGWGSWGSLRNVVPSLNVARFVNGVACRCYIFSNFSWDSTPGVRSTGVDLGEIWNLVNRSYYAQIRITVRVKRLK